MDCSEEFYKECVELELKNPVNQNDKNKMEEILKRVYQSDGSYPDDRSEDNHDDSNVDSDDDDEVFENIKLYLIFLSNKLMINNLILVT